MSQIVQDDWLWRASALSRELKVTASNELEVALAETVFRVAFEGAILFR